MTFTTTTKAYYLKQRVDNQIARLIIVLQHSSVAEQLIIGGIIAELRLVAEGLGDLGKEERRDA